MPLYISIRITTASCGFSATARISSKVIDVGGPTNRKRVCDFLLVRNSNLGPILHRFGDFAAFIIYLLPTPT